MNEIKIAIVDDELESIEFLKKHIAHFCDVKGKTYKITHYFDGKEIMKEYRPSFDIIFLDIDMTDIDGIKTAELIREVDTDTIIIFVTQMAQYAIKGYQVEALDFMVKPVEYYSFELVFRKALRYLDKTKDKSIMLNVKNEAKILSQTQIYYVEVFDHYLTYHTVKEDIRIKGTLADAEKMLDSSMFYRCNRCYLVNVQHITALHKDHVTVGGLDIGVSRAKKKQMLKVITTYLGGSI